MSRADISDKLVHFTGPRDNWNEAFARLQSILGERTIRGGNNKIRSGDHCVCFTEAPLNSLPGGLVNPKNFSRYAPFGLMFDKKWIFEKGGRPVIYQPESEFSELPESHKWRHVRYEPDTAQPIDFTWEREWRIKSQGLSFQRNDVMILVPQSLTDSGGRQKWLDALRREHEAGQDYEVEIFSMLLGQIAEGYRENFPWRVSVLGV